MSRDNIILMDQESLDYHMSLNSNPDRMIEYYPGPNTGEAIMRFLDEEEISEKAGNQ
jgi:hypothetical protein